MKAIIIAEKNKEADRIVKLMRVHFPKIFVAHETSFSRARDTIGAIGVFDIVMVDLALKINNFTELLREFSLEYKQCPIVFLGPKGLFNGRIPQDLYTINSHSTYIQYPLDIRSFKQQMLHLITQTEEILEENATIIVDKNDYTSFRLRNFYYLPKLPCDAYLELSEQKFVKVINKDEDYHQGLIDKLMSRSVKYLYLEKTQYLLFLQETAENVIKLLDQKKITSTKFYQIQLLGVAILQEHVRSLGVSDLMIKLASKIIDKSIEHYEKDKSIIHLLKEYPFSRFDIVEKSLFLIYLCFHVLENLKFEADVSKKKLALAGLLHDCFLTDESLIHFKNIEEIDRETYSDELISDYYYHPERAEKMSHLFNGLPECDFIISQHQERPGGKGFPGQLTANQITKFSGVFILADEFTQRMAKGPIKMSHILSVLKGLNQEFNEGNYKEPLRSLQTVFLSNVKLAS